MFRTINIYNNNKLSRLKSVQEDKDLRSHVRDILHQKANGTFLWVALMVQELEDAESLDPLKVAEEAPSGLYQLYNRMVDQRHAGSCFPLPLSHTTHFTYPR